MSEALKELNKILESVSSAKQQLVSDNTNNVQLHATTSSPLSAELAEKSVTPRGKPKVTQGNELHTLSQSITAMTEELMDEITNIKAKLAKAYSDNADPIPKVNENTGEINKLKDELYELKETLEDETARCGTLAAMISCANQQNEQLHGQIEELEIELSDVQDNLKTTVSFKDRELAILKRTMEAKDETGKSVEKQIEQFEASFQAKLAKQAEEEGELKSRIENLAAENAILCAKRKETTICDLSETLEDLRTILEAVSSAKHQLANDSSDNVQLQGPTSSPLSVELAEAEECLSQQVKPDVNQRNELHTLSHSITAMTEELMDEITNIKVKLAKACSDNADPIPNVDENIGEINKLKDELCELKETLEDETARCGTLAAMISCANQQNEQLHGQIEELEIELSDVQDNLKTTVSFKERELAILKRTMEAKDETSKSVEKQIEQFEASFQAKLSKQAEEEEELKSRIENLAAENAILCAKRKETTICDLSETLEDLRTILEAVSSAKHQLANDSSDNVQLQGPTSSPLSVELAEAEECLSQQVKPDVNQRNELHTLSHSITAMTEELMDEITKTKTKLAKAYSDNVDPIPKVDENTGEINKLKEELYELGETLKDETARCETLAAMISCANQQNEQLRGQIEELEAELSKTQTELKNTISYKDRELTNLKRNIVEKDQIVMMKWLWKSRRCGTKTMP